MMNHPPTLARNVLLLLGCASTALMVIPAATLADQSRGIRGQVSATETTVLAAPLSGRLAAVTRRIGESVREGEPLIRFDCRSMAAEEEIMDARLAAASAQRKVNSRLAQFGNISDLDVELSRVAVAEAAAELKRVKIRLDDCVILAPFDAEIVARQANPFQFVSHGEPLLELVNARDIEVEAVIPAAWLGVVKTGTSLSFVADATGAAINAEIVRTVDRIDPVSQTLKVIARPTDGDTTGIKPGMSGEVFFDTPQQSPADANPSAISKS